MYPSVSCPGRRQPTALIERLHACWPAYAQAVLMKGTVYYTVLLFTRAVGTQRTRAVCALGPGTVCLMDPQIDEVM